MGNGKDTYINKAGTLRCRDLQFFLVCVQQVILEIIAYRHFIKNAFRLFKFSDFAIKFCLHDVVSNNILNQIEFDVLDILSPAFYYYSINRGSRL